MENRESVNVDTKLTKNSASVTTALEMDWSGVKPEQLRDWARRTVVINYQRVQRDAGKIPTKDKISVADFMAGKGRPDRVLTPEKIAAGATKLDLAGQEALLRTLQESVKAAKAAVKK